MSKKRAFAFLGLDTYKLLMSDLSLEDVQLLSYIKWISSSPKMDKFIMNDVVYVWVKMDKIIDENPNLKIKQRAMNDKLNTLCKNGFLDKMIRCDEGSKLKKTYWGVKNEFDELRFSYIKDDESNDDSVEEKEVGIDNAYQENGDRIKYQAIFDCWNEVAKKTKLSSVSKITQDRKNKIKTRIKNGFTEEDICRAFGIVMNSSFMQGNNNNNWKVTFDWVIDSDSHLTKILEGNYNNNDDVKISKITGKPITAENSGNRNVI